jgi:transitional endoplasmic reticulum ATPase
MDGFRPDVPMLVISTTNRLDIIDDALLRPSRFRPIGIDLPDQEARLAIARVHARHFGIAVSPELLHLIAATTNALNGDEIRSLFRDACVGFTARTRPSLPMPGA